MTFTLRNGVFVAETDDGVALLDEDSGQYYDLNSTGVLILRSLLNDGTPDHAIRELTEQYEVDADTARHDVADLIRELCSTGLVVREVPAEPTPRHRWAIRKGTS
ncbi:lasso peptide biosynthesis PqqD family chaperone [Nocardia sp. NPDC051570]|uniref:lasso peptide biosynthesis PqqD family chaperone n=1 Tax=Nocardia sp. NPDC051570 TaxID=3364324 RepID=UPI0037ACA739